MEVNLRRSIKAYFDNLWACKKKIEVFGEGNFFFCRKVSGWESHLRGGVGEDYQRGSFGWGAGFREGDCPGAKSSFKKESFWMFW